MKTAVHFGAGKIGRGFIGDLLYNTGYKIIFADVSQNIIDELNNEGRYSLFLIDHNYEEKIVDNVQAFSTISQQDEVITKLETAAVITTSVMATNLDKVAPIIAKGLKKRIGKNLPRVPVIACENAIMGTNILKKEMIKAGIITENELDEVATFPNAAVDRMVFDGIHDGKQGIEIGDDFELAIEENKLDKTEKQPIKDGEYVTNIDKYLQRKIYIINCGHASTAYLAQRYGYETIQQALNDLELRKLVRGVMDESASALQKKYSFSKEELDNYIETMFIKRYTTPGISDPITRVGREPVRKLASNDRIMGPANQCEQYQLDNHLLLKAAAAGLHFHNQADKQAVEIQEFIKSEGIKKAITKYTGAKADSPMFNRILQEYQNV